MLESGISIESTRMKQFTITIPDQEENSFVELMKSVPYITQMEETTFFDIPEEQKQLVRDRIETYKNSPESYLSLEDLADKLRLE